MAEKKSNLPEKGKRKKDQKTDKPAEKFRFAQIGEFTGEVKSEFNKIAWPNKKHTMASSMVVIVLVSLMAMYLGAVDLFVGKLVSLIMN